jgi:aspartate racemase
MKVIGWIGDMSWSSSWEYWRLVDESAAEELGSSQSARIILYDSGVAEAESNAMLGVLSGRERK